jgi:Holliday junction DNA helicase RuvB
MESFRQPTVQAVDDVPQEDRALRPQRFSEMVGQRAVFERLSIAVDASRKRGETLGHILLDGPPGLGKTTFATCIPKELGTTLQIASGAALAAPKDLLPYLTNAAEGSVLFIDEIHRLPIAVEEFLYPAMEDFRIDITLGDGVSARTINMPLRPFTLVGATTRPGLLSAPLRDRFVMREHLDFYSVEDLAEIVRRSAVKLDMPMDDATADEVARRSRARHGWPTTGSAGSAISPPAAPRGASTWTSPARRSRCRASTNSAWMASTAATSRRSSGCSPAVRSASKRSPTL